MTGASAVLRPASGLRGVPAAGAAGMVPVARGAQQGAGRLQRVCRVKSGFVFPILTYMPLFVIERHFAEQIEMTRDRASEIELINADVGVQWLFSFLSADRKKSYCLYEAPSAEAIREAALRANVPADVIVEVSEVRPEAFT